MSSAVTVPPKPQPLANAPLLYGLAFALALALRLINLGTAPLSEQEATWALQALALARHGAGALPTGGSTPPAYLVPAALLFALFGATEFWARFLPALAGASLIWAVYIVRDRMTPWVGLTLAFGLAIDPGLVVVSRQAAGPMIALSTVVWVLAAWSARRYALVGVALGLALLCGAPLFHGGLTLGLSGLVYLILFAPRRKPSAEGSSPGEATTALAGWRPLGVAAAAAFLVVGSAFLRYPAGLAAPFQGLLAYLQGWVQPGSTAAETVLLALLAYEGLVLTFALLTVALLVRSSPILAEIPSLRNQAFLGAWAGVALLLIWFYPARQVNDLVWCLLPLWGLAAESLAIFPLAALREGRKTHVMSYLQGAVVVVLAFLLWNTLVAREVVVSGGLSWTLLRLAMILGILSLGALTSLLVALGWSWEICRNGLLLGFLAVLLVNASGVLWGAAYLRPNQPQELWGTPPGPGQEPLLQKTLDDLSHRARGMSKAVDVLSLVDTATLRWTLRDYPNARFSQAMDREQLPTVLITSAEAEVPQVAETYRGQDFVWWVWPAWAGGIPPDLLGWWTFRKAPLTPRYIILWARSTLFSGAP